MIEVAAADPSPQVPLHYVLSIGAIIVSGVIAVFQWLARQAWSAREKLSQEALSGVRLTADQALTRVAEAVSRQHDFYAQLELLKQSHARTLEDVQTIQQSMVTREVLNSQLSAQTATLKQSISEAVRGSSRYPTPTRTESPPPLPPMHPRQPSRPR